jgi:DegV family protein with EDD domain
VSTRIVTDSLSDITNDMAAELGITVVPLTVLFGREAYLDRVTIKADEFYRRLVEGTVWPTTTQPTPAAFAEVYRTLAEQGNDILVITLSSKLSGTYQSAIGAKPMVKKSYQIEVIDSETVAMGLGLIVMSAAAQAQQGVKLKELVEFVNRAKSRSHFVAYFDTLKYLAKGGRIGKARGFLGSLLSVKPILTVRDGEMAPLTRVRSMGAGLEYLYSFATGYAGRIEALAIEHTTTVSEADTLAARLDDIIPNKQIRRSTVSPVLGTYGGPGAFALTVLEAEGN